MSEDKLESLPQEAHAYIIQDLLKRLGRLENNDLHPRLTNVEVGLNEIRQEFRIIRDEQRAAGARSDENFKILAQKLEQSIKAVSDKHDKQIEKVADKLSKVGFTLAYWVGGITAVGAVLTLLLTHGGTIISILQ